MLKQPGEIPLLLGLAVWSVGCAILGLPLLGTLAVLSLGPVALALFILGAWRGREQAAPPSRRIAGLVLLLLGLAALIWTSLETNQLAYQWAVATQPPPHVAKGNPPPVAAWMRNAASWLVPALLCGAGLRLWSNWPNARCLGWAAAVLAVQPVKLVLYRLMLLTDPVLGT
jgi:hypothetical protein